ncbi:hypothetical protein LTR17_013569 [Elasticomyces elasticus]|nr:hypothetical protein LTR17_013569 [Elasticomyces elasticus]
MTSSSQRETIATSSSHSQHAASTHVEAIEEIWGKSSRPRVILPTRNAILSMASGITRELLAKIVSPKDALALKGGREMLRAALCRMWNERLTSNLVEAKGYHPARHHAATEREQQRLDPTSSRHATTSASEDHPAAH